MNLAATARRLAAVLFALALLVPVVPRAQAPHTVRVGTLTFANLSKTALPVYGLDWTVTIPYTSTGTGSVGRPTLGTLSVHVPTGDHVGVALQAVGAGMLYPTATLQTNAGLLTCSSVRIISVSPGVSTARIDMICATASLASTGAGSAAAGVGTAALAGVSSFPFGSVSWDVIAPVTSTGVGPGQAYPLHLVRTSDATTATVVSNALLGKFFATLDVTVSSPGTIGTGMVYRMKSVFVTGISLAADGTTSTVREDVSYSYSSMESDGPTTKLGWDFATRKSF